MLLGMAFLWEGIIWLKACSVVGCVALCYSRWAQDLLTGKHKEVHPYLQMTAFHWYHMWSFTIWLRCCVHGEFQQVTVTVLLLLMNMTMPWQNFTHIIIDLVAAKCNVVLMTDLNISLQDFTEMIVHHMATLLLMYLSWMVNFTRVGTLVLLVHDCVDPIMEVSGAHLVSGQFPPLPTLSLDSSHPYPPSHWTVPILTHPVSEQVPPLPTLSLDRSHPYPPSHWTVITLTHPFTGQLSPLPTLSLDSYHPYPPSHWTVPTLTHPLTWQLSPVPTLALDSSHPYPPFHWTVITVTHPLTGQL